LDPVIVLLSVLILRLNFFIERESAGESKEMSCWIFLLLSNI